LFNILGLCCNEERKRVQNPLFNLTFPIACAESV
jgi:hypothetical protein